MPVLLGLRGVSAQPGTWVGKVQISTDDAYDDFGWLQLDGSTVWMAAYWGPQGSNHYDTGLRMTKVSGDDIPPGATITNARLRVYGSGYPPTGSSGVTRIKAEKGSNPQTYSTLEDFDSRELTDATAEHDIQVAAEQWESIWHEFSCTAVVQEVVNDPAYQSSHAIAIRISPVSATGTSQYHFRTYDFDPTLAAELIVDWES